jgi:hypothetical protein
MPIQTFTLNILDINQVSNNIWRLTFNPNNTTLTSQQSSSPITQSNTLSVVELNPFINDVANFTNSDYNAIINNAVISRPNDKFFDVDFSSNQFTAVNEASIISASRGIGFATPSTVPQSNYTTARIINPRYIGKELTSAQFNEYTGPTTNFTSSLGFQTGSYPGDISYGAEPVINLYDSCIYEFDWGGGGYPEYVNGGTLSLGNILLVDSLDNVNIIPPSNPIYIQILESNLKNSTTIYPQTYAPGGNLGSELNVVYQGAEAPSISAYYIPSSASVAGVGTGSSGIVTDYFGGFTQGQPNFQIIDINSTDIFYTVNTNQDGFEITGSSLTSSVVYNDISSSLSNSTKRWFISLYNNLGISASSKTLLQGIISGSNTTFGSINTLVPPIEITDVEIKNVDEFFIFASNEYDWSVFSISQSSTTLSSVTRGQGGALIWSSPAGSTRIIVSGSDSSAFSGVGQGAFTTQYPNPIIPENFQSITKTYGSNKT